LSRGPAVAAAGLFSSPDLVFVNWNRTIEFSPEFLSCI
jgi:hypothetical protein